MTTTVQGETWHDANDPPYRLTHGQDREDTAILKVDPGDGDVQLQFRNSAGDWTTPDNENFTISAFSVVDIPLWNIFPMQIVASGTAKFAVLGG